MSQSEPRQATHALTRADLLVCAALALAGLALSIRIAAALAVSGLFTFAS